MHTHTHTRMDLLLIIFAAAVVMSALCTLHSHGFRGNISFLDMCIFCANAHTKGLWLHLLVVAVLLLLLFRGAKRI